MLECMLYSAYCGHKRKYRLSKWDILCRPKDQGGPGIMNLEVQKKCLLSKWLFKLTNKDDIWQQILRNKYLGSKTLTQVEKKSGESQFWSGLMSVKQYFLKSMMFKVQNEKQTRFWEDKWMENSALKDQ